MMFLHENVRQQPFTKKKQTVAGQQLVRQARDKALKNVNDRRTEEKAKCFDLQHHYLNRLHRRLKFPSRLIIFLISKLQPASLMWKLRRRCQRHLHKPRSQFSP